MQAAAKASTGGRQTEGLNKGRSLARSGTRQFQTPSDTLPGSRVATGRTGRTGQSRMPWPVAPAHFIAKDANQPESRQGFGSDWAVSLCQRRAGYTPQGTSTRPTRFSSPFFPFPLFRAQRILSSPLGLQANFSESRPDAPLPRLRVFSANSPKARPDAVKMHRERASLYWDDKSLKQ